MSGQLTCQAGPNMIVLLPVRRHQWDERDDAEPAPVSRRHRYIVRRRLWRSLCAGAFRATETARDQRNDPARQIL